MHYAVLATVHISMFNLLRYIIYYVGLWKFDVIGDRRFIAEVYLIVRCGTTSANIICILHTDVINDINYFSYVNNLRAVVQWRFARFIGHCVLDFQFFKYCVSIENELFEYSFRRHLKIKKIYSTTIIIYKCAFQNGWFSHKSLVLDSHCVNVLKKCHA